MKRIIIATVAGIVLAASVMAGMASAKSTNGHEGPPATTLTAAVNPTSLLVGGSGAVTVSGTETDRYGGISHAAVIVGEFNGATCADDSIHNVHVYTTSDAWVWVTDKWGHKHLQFVKSDGGYTAPFTLDTTTPGTYSFMAFVDRDNELSNCVTVTINSVHEDPNAVAYCYAVDPVGTTLAHASLNMITPDRFGWLISPPGYGSTAAEHWGTGFMASWLPGVGFYCGQGTPTGGHVDTSGFPISAAGYASFLSTYGFNTWDIRSTNHALNAIEEAYPVVTVP